MESPPLVCGILFLTFFFCPTGYCEDTNHLQKVAYISWICTNTLDIIQAPSCGLPPSCRSHGE